MSVINALKWTALTALVNQIKSPNQFLHRLLFSNHQTLPVETILLGSVIGGREIAPFVRKNGEAILVGGTTSKEITVEGPNIRLKQAFHPSVLLYQRQVGTQVLLTPGQNQLSAVEQAIARDTQHMANMVTNAQEYLASRVLQGSIAYNVEDAEVFTITIPRDSDNNITLSVFWDNGGANARPLQNIHKVKEVMSEAEGLAPTDAICGAEAAHALLELHESGNIKLLGLQTAQPTAGMISFVEQFNDDGVIFLGTLAGVRFWQYSRTAKLNGVAQDMIRPKYVEFISTSPASERVEYYAAIPDFDAIQSGLLQTERFSKSWLEKDPSQQIQLVHSRPLPWPRKPNATVSMKVVSG
jgi:hypothetical protein